ncbi:MAG: radical SAM protein [Acidobacteriota bacterium]
MPETSVQTESLCPLCLQRTKALRTTEADRVYLEKTCPTHGKLNRVLLWKNYPYSYTKWQRTCGEDTNDTLDSSVNCPFDCGICPGHRQDTCTAILEVTHRCNLRCPVCFADTETAQITEPSKQQIARMLETVLDRSGTCPVQFSGGEPTLRDDLPEIASLARSMGFEHIQVNTNGLRLSREPGFCEALKKAGVSTIFLQFDGLTDEVHMHFRGAALSEIKCKAVEYCSQYKLGVILVPTLARGINDNQRGAIIQFAKERIPAVRGVHFQPMA